MFCDKENHEENERKSLGFSILLALYVHIFSATVLGGLVGTKGDCLSTYRWLVARPSLLIGFLVCSPVLHVCCNKQRHAQTTNMSLSVIIYFLGCTRTIFSTVLFVVLL